MNDETDAMIEHLAEPGHEVGFTSQDVDTGSITIVRCTCGEEWRFDPADGIRMVRAVR